MAWNIYKILNTNRILGVIFVVSLLLSQCKKDIDINSLVDTKINEGICIYPVRSMLVNSPPDTTFTNVDRLGDTPYIAYKDIISYDTVFHILELKFSLTQLAEKIDKEYLSFAVTLNGEILYKGNFVYKTVEPSKDPVIFLDNTSDTLANNKIRIYSKFPLINSDFYTDARYQPALNKRLKKDGKAYGSLYYDEDSSDSKGSDIEFYFIDSIGDISNYNKTDILNLTDLSLLKLKEEPFIAYSNIVFYDSANSIFYLREPVDFTNYNLQELIQKFYAITIGGTPVLVGGFYLSLESRPCPYLHIFPDLYYQNPINKYLLRLYPGTSWINTPNSVTRNEAIIQILKQDGKIRNNFVI